MSPGPRVWLLLVPLGIGLSPVTGHAQDSTCAAVRYMEMPERGPHAQTGRPIKGRSGSVYGVDINSTIHLSVDTLCLLSRLDERNSGAADQPARLALARRMDSLTSVLGQIPIAIKQLQETFDAYARGPVALADFEAKLDTSSTTIQRILRTLRSAIRARLESEGVAPAQAERQSARDLDPVLSDEGYDWDALRQLLDRELRSVAADLDRLRRGEAYQVEVRSHLLTSKGQFPVPLAGYNEEAPCAETRVEPIQLAPSPDQAALYQHAESLEKTIGEVRGIGQVVVAQVSADVERVRPQVDTLLTRAEHAVAPVVEAGKGALRWADPPTFSRWLEGLALGGGSKEVDARRALDSLGTELGNVSADIDLVRSLVTLRDDLRGATAIEGMQAVVARAQLLRQTRLRIGDVLRPSGWKNHADLSARLAARIGQLGAALRDRIRNDPNGPMPDVERLRGALLQAADSLRGVSEDGVKAVSQLLGLPPALLAADLPEPAGLHRRAIGAGLETDIQLTRICAERHENDAVQVEYRFFAGDKPIAGAGWTDRFRLRIYGWSARFAAGLAFAVRQHTDVWRPGAAVSWIFTHAGWPSGTKLGAGDALGLGRVGLGLTAVNLHFESAEAIELGLGPTLSLIGDRVIVGGGWNLQAHGDHLYGLLSVRLLDIARTN